MTRPDDISGVATNTPGEHWSRKPRSSVRLRLSPPGRERMHMRLACGLLLASLIGCGDTAAPLKESEIPLVQANYALKSVNGVSLPVYASYKIPSRRVSLTAGGLEILPDRRWKGRWTYFIHEGGRIPYFYGGHYFGEFRFYNDSSLSLTQQEDPETSADSVTWVANVDGNVITVYQETGIYRYERSPSH